MNHVLLSRQHEIGLPGPVVGLDEVGSGPLAGPSVAAAVILPGSPHDEIHEELREARDSKKLSRAKRERLADAILRHCLVGVGEASPAEIDRINILRASHLAMQRAIALLGVAPGHALVDGNRIPKGLPCPATTIVKGDDKCLAIAAASIVAKVHRDRIMDTLDAECPGYGWARNAGYPTREHREAIATLGVTRHHRRSFTLLPEADLFSLAG